MWVWLGPPSDKARQQGLRWYGHVKRRDEESILRAVTDLKRPTHTQIELSGDTGLMLATPQRWDEANEKEYCHMKLSPHIQKMMVLTHREFHIASFLTIVS